jgi:exodeoxyribonuclease-3
VSEGLSLLCWNVAGRVRALPAQLAWIATQSPDVVCLQEIRASTEGTWRQGLAELGLSHCALAVGGERPRALRVLTAARRPLERVAIDGLPWPERVLATRIGGVEIVNLHSPISPSPNLAKVLTHEAVHAHLAEGEGPRLLCGDLNTPRREHPDGQVWTFARDRYGRLVRGERWDAAELALIKGLEPFGFRDAFRALHGPAVRELSWGWARWEGGYRLDHVIASRELRVPVVRYLHEPREAGLSDHSTLWVCFATACATPITAACDDTERDCC